MLEHNENGFRYICDSCDGISPYAATEEELSKDCKLNEDLFVEGAWRSDTGERHTCQVCRAMYGMLFWGQKMREYIVCADYDFDWDYTVKDYRLEQSVGRDTSGSGCGCGFRDVSWMFKQYPAARRAAMKLKRFRFINSVSILTWNTKINEYDAEELIKP
jgi:hypothetical protein